MDRWNVVSNRKCLCRLVIGLAVLLIPTGLLAGTAREILERVANQSFGEAFRGVLSTTIFKETKAVSTHVMWVMGRSGPEMTSIFIAFEEPEERKGLRYLFQVQRDKELNGFMYDPAAQKTVRIGQDDASADLGGSGLRLDDIQGFVPKRGEVEAVVRHEKVENRQCAVIFISRPEEKAGRLVWIEGKNNVVVKMQTLNAQGKIIREMNVTKFFRNESGQEFPREEEITVPEEKIRVRVRQEHGLFGVEIPSEAMDAKQFGNYKWSL